MIHIGTSGYHFKDWKGPFYTEGMSDARMLPFYSQHFDIVELNVTYYRIPSWKTMESMVRKTPDRFMFTVKTHQSLTHERKGDSLSDTAFLASVAPIAESGRMAGLLAQFPWNFRYSIDNIEYMLHARDAMNPYPLFVEFRNVSWARPDVIEKLRAENIGYCVVDAPKLDGLMPYLPDATTRTAYFRFHGRNATDWWKPRPGSDRYLYKYSEQELESLAADIKKISKNTDKTLVLLNNCHFGHAPKNALRLKGMLGVSVTSSRPGELSLET